MVAAQQQQRQDTRGVAPAEVHKGTALAVPDEVRRLEATLNGMTHDFAAALPAAAKARVGDFLRMALIDVPRQRGLIELAASNPSRIIIALMDIARLGLFPGSKLGEAWVIPFAVGKGKDRRPDCQAVIGYQGYLKLARNSGLIESVCARAVYKGDEFEVRYGLHEDIVHIPGRNVDRSDPNLVIGCYSIAKFKGGGHHLDFMTDQEIMAIARRSKTYNSYEGTWSGPWATDWIQMAIKTVLRRAQKQWPKSVEMAEASSLDERDEIVVHAEEATTRPALGAPTKASLFNMGAFADNEPEPAWQEAPEPAHAPQQPPAEQAPAQPTQAAPAAAAPAKRAPAAKKNEPAAAAKAPDDGGNPPPMTAAEKAEILRLEREESEREAAARDRARGD
jgi:recombination protein RecT